MKPIHSTVVAMALLAMTAAACSHSGKPSSGSSNPTNAVDQDNPDAGQFLNNTGTTPPGTRDE